MVDIIFTTLAFITVCFRLFTRVVLVQNVGSDDYYIVGSMVSFLFFVISFYLFILGPEVYDEWCCGCGCPCCCWGTI